MNEGIRKANGDLILILNSDDILNSNTIIEETIKKIKKNPNYDVFLGNVVYFSFNNYSKIIRFFKASNSRVKNLLNGDMPPHPASFIKKKIYDKYGLYNTNFKIASDFDFFLRIFKKHKVKFKILENQIVRMRTGGASDQNIKSYIITTKEILKSIKINNFERRYFRISFRALKIKELIFLNQKILNKDFKLFNFDFQKKNYEKKTFQILNSIQNLDLKKNFILSGMNLAFLGYYSKKDVLPQKNLIHWPDGIFTKKIINLNKIPGRELLNKIKFPKDIKSIRIIGNITENSKKFLKKKFKLNIYHTQLPYAPLKELLKKKFITKNSEVIFITLPILNRNS